MKKSRGKFTAGSIWRHVLVMTFTGAVGLITTFLADLVDILFISHLGSSHPAAGVGFAAAVLYFVRSVAVALGIAASVLVSRAIGRGKSRYAARYAMNASIIACSIITGIIITVMLNREYLLTMVGAQGENLRYAEMYLNIVLPGISMISLGMCGNAVIRALGGATVSMWVSITAALTNAALDPIFIFALHGQLKGAAWATVASQFVLMAASWSIIIFRYRLLTPVRLRYLREDFSHVMNVAVPAMLTNLSAPLTTAYAARQMAQFGADAVAAFTVIMRVTPVCFAVIFSLSGAIAPIIGQNAGAGLFDRVRKTLFAAFKFNWLVVISISLILFSLRRLLPGWFALNPQAAGLLMFYCSGIIIFFGFNGMIFACNAAFNNLGRPFYATTANFSRIIFGSLPVITIAQYYLGARGVILGYLTEGILIAPVSALAACKLIHAYRQGMPLYTQRLRDIFTRP